MSEYDRNQRLGFAEVQARKGHRWHYGDRVELVATTDEFTALVPGDRGTVTRTDSLGTIHVRWDSGSRLGIIEEAGDVIRLVREGETNE
jgi:Domain of unknown function (DUF4314)